MMIEPSNDKDSRSNFFSNLFFHIPDRINPLSLIGRALLYGVILIWGIRFICAPMGSYYDASASFIHMVNLPFHEAGHIIFRPFGAFITSLGGTLSQMLVPLICLYVFLFRTRDTFGASVSLWWFGENFLDIAPYIDDARSLSLPLIGGRFGYSSPYGFHDWQYILTESNLLRYDHLFANISLWTGRVIIIFSFTWAGYILLKQFKAIRKKPTPYS